MGKCFLYGNSGGGSDGLQFVSGSTEPANPSEGLIWVESSLAGKKCVVSISEPENPKEGLVWFNPVDYYSPAVCKVYTSSTWETVSACIYSLNTWELLCWNGIVVPDAATGRFGKLSGTTYTPVYVVSDSLTNMTTITSLMLSSSLPVAASRLASPIAFDVTNFNTLKFTAKYIIDKVTITSSGSQITYVSNIGLATVRSASQNKPASYNKRIARTRSDKDEISGELTESVDISDLSGLYFIIIDLEISATSKTTISNGSASATWNYSKIWFE